MNFRYDEIVICARARLSSPPARRKYPFRSSMISLFRSPLPPLFVDVKRKIDSFLTFDIADMVYSPPGPAEMQMTRFLSFFVSMTVSMLNMTALIETTDKRTPRTASCKTSLDMTSITAVRKTPYLINRVYSWISTPCSIHTTPDGVSQTWYIERDGGEEDKLKKVPR